LLAVCCAAAQAEAGVLKGMKDQFRVCVATVGDGAAAEPNLYDYMYGSIIIWMGELRRIVTLQPAAAAPAASINNNCCWRTSSTGNK
jgi:hypothetical protein